MTPPFAPPLERPVAHRWTPVPPDRAERHLEVLPRGFRSPRSRRRRARLLVAIGVVVGCGVLFGLAGVHVLLTEGQFRLARLQKKADDAQAQYVWLRLQVAQLESPQRIVADAQERLNMVPPSAVTYLTPTSSMTAPGPARTATQPSAAPTRQASLHGPDATQGWALAKRVLAGRP